MTYALRGYSPPQWEGVALGVAWCGNGSSQHGLFTPPCARKQRTHSRSGVEPYLTKPILSPPRNPLLAARLILGKVPEPS